MVQSASQKTKRDPIVLFCHTTGDEQKALAEKCKLKMYSPIVTEDEILLRVRRGELSFSELSAS